MPPKITDDARNKPNLSERLFSAFTRKPKDKKQLIRSLHNLVQDYLIDADALSMIEGVVQVSEMNVRDIMIPRAQMVVLHHNQNLKEILPTIIQSAHSRFPVIGDDKDSIVGILLAKELLRHIGLKGPTKGFNMRTLVHPALFIPESKRLDRLLKEFRDTHTHMAIVVNEYNHIVGLITIEDVLEQVVGEIEDEHFVPEQTEFIQKIDENHYILQALTPIDQFNKQFHVNLDDQDFDTLGGLIAQRFGHLPKRGESIIIEHFEFHVLRADKRCIRQLRLDILPLPEVTGNTDKHDDDG